jgi:predicted RNA methylase
LYQWFVAASPLTRSDSTGLPSGLALSPELAAQCVLDTHRTVAFLRGIAAAIEEAHRRFDGVLEVVYAGTGPFAPLAIPLMPLPRVHFTLIDIHDAATSNVRQLLDRLGLHASVVRADATTYEHPSPIHIVITETMQRALQKEPFVAVTRNLRRQLAPRGVLIPERVTVDFALIDPAAEQARWNGAAIPPHHERLATVAEITADRELMEPMEVTIPRDGQWPALLTRVDVFGDAKIDDYESGLTMPEVLWHLAPSRAGNIIRIEPKDLELIAAYMNDCQTGNHGADSGS